MNWTKLLAQVVLPLTLCLIMFSCTEQGKNEKFEIEQLASSRGQNSNNSFSQVLRIALEKTLSDERLPMKEELLKNHFIKDSILLCIDLPRPLDKLEIPAVGDFKFKLLAKEELCRLLIEKGEQVAPPYLYIHSIQDNGASVRLKVDNTCISVVNVNSHTDACDYLSHCGGGMEIFCSKKGCVWSGEIAGQWGR